MEGSREELVTALIAVVAVLAVVVVLSAVHLLPQLRNPFTQTTTDRGGSALFKSITSLSRYEAANGSFQVVVDLTKRVSFIPSFLQGSETLFIGQGSDIAYVDFSQLKGQAIQVSPDRTTVSVKVPHAQLGPAVLNVDQSYVYAEQQGLSGTSSPATRTASSRSTCSPSRRSRPPPTRARWSPTRSGTPRPCSRACSARSASPT